eukprot:7092963-Prymnesium_polylepis.2
MNGLDASGEGMRQTHERKLAVIASRYPDLAPKQVITRLLGADVSLNDAGVTGEQGGRLLACFLLSVKDNAECAFLSRVVTPWLEQQLPKMRTSTPRRRLASSTRS